MRGFISIILLLTALSTESLSENIKIGISLPLTGAGAEYGVAVQNAFTLAKEEKAELKRFDYVFDDNAYLAAKSVDSYHKLRRIDQAQIIYHWGEPGFAAVAPLAESEKFPFFCMSTDRTPGIGKKYSVRVSGDSYQLAKPVVDYLRKNGATSVDLLMAEDPYFEAARKSLTELIGPEVKINTVGAMPTDTIDFRTLILKLKVLKPKFTAVFLMAGQVRNFFTQANKVGFKSQFIGTDVFESKEEIKESGVQINGSIYSNFYVPEIFRKAYVERFGNDTQISHAYTAYAFARALPKIAPEDSKLDSESILKNVETLSLQSTDGAFEYIDSKTEGKHFEFKVVLREVKDGAVRDL